MKKEEWMDRVVEEVKRNLSEEFQVELCRRESPISGIEKVIGIRKDPEPIGIAVYLELGGSHDFTEEGAGKVAKELLKEYRWKHQAMHQVFMDFSDFSQVEAQIVYVLENKKWNEKALLQVPYEEYLDLAKVYHLHQKVEDEQGKITFLTRTITNRDIEEWGVSESRIKEAAEYNTPIVEAPYVYFLQDPVREETDEEREHAIEYVLKTISDGNYDPKNPVILTNLDQQYGAAGILYDGILERIAEAWKDDILITLTSLHEALLVPENQTSRTLEEMRQDAYTLNRIDDMDNDRLSDSIYRYSRADKTISIAAYAWES